MTAFITPNESFRQPFLLSSFNQSAEKKPAEANLNELPFSQSEELTLSKASHTKEVQYRSYESTYQRSETMSFSLKTQEGDSVQIDFNRLQLSQEARSYYAEASEGVGETRFFEQVSELSSAEFSEQFGVVVKGDLNSEEQQSIAQVLQQVDELVNQFFEGNLVEAFAHTQNFDVDFEQLQSVDLNLRKQESSIIRYKEVESYSSRAMPANNAFENLFELPEYVQKMQSAIETMEEQFQEAQATIETMMAMMNPDPSRTFKGSVEELQKFHKEMFNAFKYF